MFIRNSPDNRYAVVAPYSIDGWTVYPVYDRETGEKVSEVSLRPLDPEVVAQFPDLDKNKEGFRYQLTEFFAGLFDH